MYIEDITDNDLREFLGWFADWHGRTLEADAVMTTCMTGYFKTYPKAADGLLTRCRKLKLLDVTKGIATITMQ